MKSVRSVLGIFDSGVGGLTVVREVRRLLPTHDIVYLGDTARVPYGNKSLQTVTRYALACQQFLLAHEVSLVMVACNTASAAALPALRERHRVPVIGAIGPGAQSALAATRGGHIGVIGTLATIDSGAYERELHQLDARLQVTAAPCALLVPLAEEGWVEGSIARAVVRRYLEPLFRRDPEIDTLVLGCTHYPLLRDVLRQTANELVSHEVVVVDSACAMAERARELMTNAEQHTSPGRLSCFVTDATRLHELGPRFLGQALGSLELVDL